MNFDTQYIIMKIVCTLQGRYIMASSVRFETISEAQLDKLVENKDAKNTKRATLSGRNVFEAYL